MRQPARLLLYIGLVALTGIGPAFADDVDGEFTVQTTATPSINAGTTVAKPTSSEATLTDAGNGLFTFKITDPGKPTARMTLAIDNPPDDVQAFRLDFNLPFFWRQDDDTKIAAALVPDKLGDNTIADIIKSGRTPGGSVTAQVLLNQQARVAFTLLRGQHNAPSNDDALMALFFVQSSKELGLNYFVRPDDAMIDAKSFLEAELAAGPAELARVFPKEIDRQSAAAAVSEFNQIDATQQQAIVNAIAKVMNAASSQTRASACLRADGVNDFLSQLSDANQARFDPNLRRTVQNLTNVMICRWRDLSWTKRPDNADDLIGNASSALEQAQAILTRYETMPDADKSVACNAIARSGELAGRLLQRSSESAAAAVTIPGLTCP